MATIHRLQDLNDDQAKLISLCLTFQPIDKNAEERKKWANAPQMYPKVVAPVTMYRVEHPEPRSATSSEFDPSSALIRPPWSSLTPGSPVTPHGGSTTEAVIRIPFRFGCSLLKRMVNHDKPYPRVAEAPLDRPNFCAMLKDYQVEPALEAYQQLQIWGSTTLKLPPGFGKTMIGAWLWTFTATVVVVLVVQQPLLRQWKKTFLTAVPGLAQSIWVVGEEPPPGPGIIPAILICMNQRTHQIPAEVKEAVGCLIIDEAHCFCTPDRVEALLAFTPKYVIAETATLERDDGMEKMIHSICGEHSVSRVATKPYSVIRLDTSITVEENRNKYGVNFNDLCNRLCALPERNMIILDIIKNNPHRKFMILTRLADHVALLQLLILNSGISCATLYRNQKTYSDSSVLIGTIPKIGTGFDEANACEDFGGVQSDTLILAGSIKKNTVFEQVRGRVMRSANPVVIYLVDRNSVCKRHFRETAGWIESTQGVISRLTYYPDTIHLPSSSPPPPMGGSHPVSTILIPWVVEASYSIASSNSGVHAPPIPVNIETRTPFHPNSEPAVETTHSIDIDISNTPTRSPIRLNLRKENSTPSSPASWTPGVTSQPCTPVKLRIMKKDGTPLRGGIESSESSLPSKSLAAAFETLQSQQINSE